MSISCRVTSDWVASDWQLFMIAYSLVVSDWLAVVNLMWGSIMMRNMLVVMNIVWGSVMMHHCVPDVDVRVVNEVTSSFMMVWIVLISFAAVGMYFLIVVRMAVLSVIIGAMMIRWVEFLLVMMLI